MKEIVLHPTGFRPVPFSTKLAVSVFLSITSFIFVIQPKTFFLDLIQSFAFHAVLGYVILGLLFLWFRKNTYAFGAFLASTVITLHLAGHIVTMTQPELKAHGRLVRVGHFNVLKTNKQFDQIIQEAIGSDADFLSFQEVNTRWAEHLDEGLMELYPYRKVVANRKSADGLAVYSKFPLQDVQVFFWSEMPNIVGSIQVDGEKVHFVASHTRSPRNEKRYQLRNNHIRRIADYVNTLQGPVLAVGDYNIVPWNAHLQQMQETAQLADSRRRLTATYPAVLQGVGLPIDYILHSKELQCLDFYSLESGGSDHRGIMGIYQLAPTQISLAE